MRIPLRPSLLPGFFAALGVLFALALTALKGPIGLAATALLIGALLLLDRPRSAAGVAIGLAIVVESESDWGPAPQLSRIYVLIPGTKISPVELLLLLALAAALLARRISRRPLRTPIPLTAPFALLVLGLVAGAITGRDAGVGTFGLFNAARSALPVLLVPFLLVQAFETRTQLRRALAVAGGLAAFKGGAGLVAFATGLTSAQLGERLTYYEAPANMVMLGFLSAMLAIALRRVPVPRWCWWAVPFVTAALLLSFRRSFWIAMVVAAVVVAIVTLGREGRRFGIPLGVIVVVLLTLVLSGGTGQVDQPTSSSQGFDLRSRALSISPTAISSNRQDRYRLGERRNVLADLRESPVAGLGLGVPWRQRYPVSLGGITHEYVHVELLWWWMKTGILGLMGYVLLLACAFGACLVVRARHPDPLVRAVAVGGAGALAGYSVAALTGTFAGPDLRSSIVLGTFLGLVTVAYHQTPTRLQARTALPADGTAAPPGV